MGHRGAEPAIVALRDAGALRGRVLDVGCGTVEHALMAAAAVDSAVLHVFDDAGRARYVESLATVLVPGGRYPMLGCSDLVPARSARAV